MDEESAVVVADGVLRPKWLQEGPFAN